MRDDEDKRSDYEKRADEYDPRREDPREYDYPQGKPEKSGGSSDDQTDGR